MNKYEYIAIYINIFMFLIYININTLEMFLMLRINKHMWGEEILQNIIDKKKATARDKAIERSKRKRNEEDENDNNEGDIEDA